MFYHESIKANPTVVFSGTENTKLVAGNMNLEPFKITAVLDINDVQVPSQRYKSFLHPVEWVCCPLEMRSPVALCILLFGEEKNK